MTAICRFGGTSDNDSFPAFDKWLDAMDECTHKPRIILDLCGGTGSWSKPYLDAGYDVRVITLPNYDVRTYEPPENVWGVLAAPPCTVFSLAGYRQGQQKDFTEPMEIVNACLKIIRETNPKWWALENPIGHLTKFLGKPTYTFHPWWFGDAWVKKTNLWGKFVPPTRIYTDWNDVPKIEGLYIRPGRSKPSIAFQHKSASVKIPQLQDYHCTTDAEFRAITPPGFAKKFMEANL